MTLQVAKIPFAKMSFTPDVPAAALGPNEYNAGQNIETDVRGIRSVAGDQEILDVIPGTPTYVTGGFRRGGEWWFVVATVEGKWWASNGIETWQDITPTVGDFTGYNQATNITESWNGTVLFLNDEHNPPMFWPDADGAVLVMYSNQQPINIIDIVSASSTENILTFTVQDNVPFQIGSYIVISGVSPAQFNGTWLVTACTDSSVTYLDATISPGLTTTGKVASAYTWNYNPAWKGVYAKFMRLYSTPNVGSILVAGNLTATAYVGQTTTTTEEIYPVTIQWSQSFGLNQAPSTWEPTITNTANQLEVPLRGPALDCFPCNGQLFLCSYWDTVVFSPLNYSTTSAPILGVRLYNQGRGLLSSNCWANTDKLVYGIDARDIWVFDGSNFQGLGNQRVKNWFYDQLDPQYYDRVFMETNTQKSQIEIFYPDRDATDGVPNKMLSYRYDIDCWNAPRTLDSATFSCESPLWVDGIPNLGNRAVVYARGCADQKLVQKDQGYSFVECSTSTSTSVILPIVSQFRRDNIQIAPKYTNKILVHRILPEVVNLGALPNQGNEIPIYPSPGNITITIEGANSVGSTSTAKTPVTIPVDANGLPGADPWVQISQNAFRVNTIEIGDSSTSTVWLCSAVTWQYGVTEEDR